MKNFSYRSYLFVLFICLSFSIQAQDDFCGTQTTQEDLKRLKEIMPQLKIYEEQYYNLLNNRSSTAISSIPIKAHIIRTSSGTGGLSETQLFDALDLVNEYYANAFMEFFICDGINYIDDTNFYNFETNEEGALRAAHEVDGLVNIFFTENVVSSNSGSSLCGYAYLPGGQDIILMANSCTVNGSTLIHEIGHFFSLLHTHGPSNSTLTTELVDGSNCDTDGDFLCDTPADPKLSYSTVSTSCTYLGNAVDNAGTPFNPDPTNIMSYSRKSCRTLLTTQQFARIYAAYQTQRNYFACASFNVDFAADYTRDCGSELTVNFEDSSVGATSWQWDVDGDDVIDYTIQNPSHTFAPGNYDVALTISNGSETITKVLANLIEFETKMISSSQVFLTLVTDDWSQETSWNFKDSEGNILYSHGNYNGTTDDFSTFEYTFDIDYNECYSFEIIDSYGDGICCFSGDGSYELRTSDNTVIASGGQIGFGETTYMSNETLGLNDFNSASISIYPNPVNDNVIHVKSSINQLHDATYSVKNLLGQDIISGSLTNDQINVSNMAPGTYFLTLTAGTNKVVKKFFKQ